MKRLGVLSLLVSSLFVASSARAAERGVPPQLFARDADLRRMVALARDSAPEVKVARATYDASRASLQVGRLAPVGNPYLEVTLLISRRELSNLYLRRLELMEQSWDLVSRHVESTGEVP